jgi:ubiquinone/menaquinone biosynthesis C-methylase UbiE
MAAVDDLIDRYYTGVPFGQRVLERTVLDMLQRQGTSARVLDAGCGWDAPLVRTLSSHAWVVGVDLSRTLPVDLRTLCADLEKLPFRDATFSIIYSRSVFEHLSDPSAVLEELWRILTPGGVCAILTPNTWDYSSVAARLTPQWFHQWFVNKTYGQGQYDTFRTLYRANSPRFFRRLAAQGRWRLLRLDGLRHYPSNLTFSRLLFRCGIAYDFLLDRLKLVSMQPSLIAVLQKPEIFSAASGRNQTKEWRRSVGGERRPNAHCER